MPYSLPSFVLDNIDLPLIVAPMFLVSGTDMVISCCKEGVIGSFPFTNARTLTELETWIVKINDCLEQERTYNKNKIAPWAANVIVHSTYARFNEELALIQKFQPKIVITALGSPSRVVSVVHNYGGIVIADVNSVEFAKKAAQTGVDGLVLVCEGAGGHTGNLSPFVFIEEVRKFWDGIVVLAGGISSGRAIRATQVLKADFAYMGTPFIATFESMASKNYKEMLIESHFSDLVKTDSVTGVPAYFLKQSLDTSKTEAINVDFSNLGYEANQKKTPWKDIWSAGHGVGLVESVVSVKELIDKLKKEYTIN